jgi:hypothetical protein
MTGALVDQEHLFVRVLDDLDVADVRLLRLMATVPSARASAEKTTGPGCPGASPVPTQGCAALSTPCSIRWNGTDLYRHSPASITPRMGAWSASTTLAAMGSGSWNGLPNRSQTQEPRGERCSYVCQGAGWDLSG